MDYRRYLEILTSRPIPKNLAFSVAEFEERVAKVRASMAARQIDALVVTEASNICYLSGYETFVPDNFACLILTNSGALTLQVAEFEIPGAILFSWVQDVRATRFNNADDLAKELGSILRDKNLDGKRIGVETKTLGLNVSLHESLKAALPNARFVDASNEVFQARLIKSPAELAHMRKAGAIVQASLKETLLAVRPGATENDIASVAYAALVKNGSEYFSSQPMVLVGERTGWIHISQRGARIKTGDTVMMELGAFFHRYLGALMHTAVLGEPSRDVLRLVKASHETLKLVESAVRPGRSAHDVAIEVKRGLADVSAEAYSTGMYGYTVGLSFPPNWQEGRFMIAEGIEEELQEGMTFLTPITLRFPGQLGIGFTDIFTVTARGCEVLVPRDRTLTVVPV